ncbi:citronellyl-CoA dehydrogenase [Herpetosiphon giganteus]|nr:acyl-CoA dehydrogenase family protein [Herpetosiphon giganteus]MBM7844052.1 citronellyl-CoA dehydrogenase [Herpetosiphon giganteus]
MSLYFNSDHEMFRQTIRRFVEREINPFVEQWEHERCFPGHALFKKLGELGALGVSYPEAYGGAGLDYWYNVVLAEEVGRADCGGVPMAILVHTDMATPALAEFGSDELRQRFLAPAIRGELIAAVAISEPDAGSDVASIRTRAVRDGDEYVINGSKMWITNGTQADFITLLARTSDEAGFKGMSLIIVPTNTPGFHVSKKLEKLGNHSSDTALLAFDDLRVPIANRIGEEGQGFGLQMQQFQKERLIGSVSAVAGMEKIVAMTINYCRERQTFGKALIENQYIHFRLAELLSEIEALRQLNYHCTRLLIAGHDITKEVSMAKLKAGRLVREVADSCLQFHGGMGYVEEYPLARYFRDSRLLSIGGGADEIMLGIIAKYAGMIGKRR